MIETKNSTLKKYAQLVNYVQSTDTLKELLEDGDWTILVTYRDLFDEENLTASEQNELAGLDKMLNTHFNTDLLEAYAESELPVADWWG